MLNVGRWDSGLGGWWNRSLKIRLAVYLTLALSLASMAVAIWAGRSVRQDMQHELERYQQSVASTIAKGLTIQFSERFALLDHLAEQAVGVWPAGPERLRVWLDEKVAASSVFNRGVFLADSAGVAVASWPESAGRLGLRYADRDYMIAALREGRASVGRPVIGRPLGKPVLLMAVPVRNAQGAVIGAIVGVTDLGRPSFLDGFIETERNAGMEYHLVDGPRRLLVAGTDPDRAMENLPAAGQNAGWDALLGSAAATALLPGAAEPLLAAGRHIDRLGWHLVVTVPESQAFAAIDTVERHVDQSVLALMMLSMLLVLWILRREFMPLQTATLALRQQARDGSPARPLPVSRPDEIGALVEAFNNLLRAVGEREDRLRVSDMAMRSISQGVLISGPDRVIQAANPSFLATTGYALDEVVGRNCAFLQGPGTSPETVQRIRDALAADRSFSGEILNYRKSGEPFWNELTISPVRDASGELIHFIGVTRDITERRRAAESQRISAVAFESQEGIFVTDADKVILRVNQAFTQITGYTAEEAVGRTPRLLSSGRHDAAFYAAMWEVIVRDGTWQGEIWNRRKSGELFPESITITAVRDESGGITHYVANFIDISARKSAEDAVRTLAFFDPLTKLPNRRLLHDRLSQALLASQRHGWQGALLFVDLDNFKALNDTRGHH